MAIGGHHLLGAEMSMKCLLPPIVELVIGGTAVCLVQYDSWTRRVTRNSCFDSLDDSDSSSSALCVAA